jgi:ADP-dependent phosphofructokinase/glucokinase
MLADENLVIAFADSVGIDPAEVARARHMLGKVWERDLP